MIRLNTAVVTTEKSAATAPDLAAGQGHVTARNAQGHDQIAQGHEVVAKTGQGQGKVVTAAAEAAGGAKTGSTPPSATWTAAWTRTRNTKDEKNGSVSAIS